MSDNKAPKIEPIKLKEYETKQSKISDGSTTSNEISYSRSVRKWKTIIIAKYDIRYL
jgi:hypothetical protein